MRHRPGITLVEVLAAIFIMAIGLLALLVLFPVGALSMARAVRDDRAAGAGANAGSLATAFDLRNDTGAVGINYGNYTTPVGGSVGSTLYVDPYYSALRSTVGDTGSSLKRVSVSYVVNRPADLTRYFSFQDEIVFANLGYPDTTDTTGGTVNRPSTYTWAYLLRHYGKGTPGTSNAPVNADTELTVVVYANRSLQVASGEPVFSGNLGSAGSNSLALNYTAGGKPNIRKGDWVLDVSPTFGPANGYFYRVDSVTDTSSTVMTLQLETPLKQTVTNLVAMQNVITVIDRGVAWKP